ncbi:MAG: hypothetical protein ACKO0M_11720 [Cyanobium sp.]
MRAWPWAPGFGIGRRWPPVSAPMVLMAGVLAGMARFGPEASALPET